MISRKFRSDLSRSGGPPRATAVAACLLLASLAGCSRDTKIQTEYGLRTGAEGAVSVNGTSVFARMFEEAGFRVSTWKRLSPNLKEYDVIVWAPDDFDPPTQRERDFFDSWFLTGRDRTLIYIGRDFDAAIGYWEKVLASAPPEQVQEVSRRLANARADYVAARSNMPKEEFCGWYTLRRDGVPRKVESLAGPYSRGIDASQVEIELRSRFDVPTDADLALKPQAEVEIDFEDFDPWAEESLQDVWDDDDTTDLPSDVRVLLQSGRDPIITRVWESYYRSGNQVIVVTNGSFLLNLPLVNHEHRKLAGRLIDDCGQPGRVAFLESGPGGLPIYEEEPGGGMPTGLEVLTVWPIGCIVMHLAVAGIIFCFARFAIFGRPKELPPDSASDFRKHVDALGELIQRTRDTKFASERLSQYQQSVRDKAG